MSKCLDHKTKFPDTHRHFRPVIEISRKFPIVRRGLELKKNNLKTTRCLDTQLMKEEFIKTNVGTPYVKRQGLVNAQIRIEIASGLHIR